MPPWATRVFDRLRFLVWAKSLGTSAFMFAFFLAYFALLEFPNRAPTVVPEIWLDKWVHFTPAAFPIYLSLWVYVSLAPALLGSFRALAWFGAWVGGLCLSGLAVFWLWPTQTPSFDLDWGLYPGLALLKGIDASGNAFPSMHVASAVFSACWLHRIFRQLSLSAWALWGNWAVCLAIAWSTMATLQHVALDVLSGAALGLAVAAASLAHIRDTGFAQVNRSAL